VIGAVEPVRENASLATAYRLLWLAVVLDLLAFGIGFDWDRRWHATHAFEDFFSLPHLFIYSMHLCTTITLAHIAFTPDLRRWFGPTFRLPIVPFPIPGAIGLAAAGFGVVALAGVFDAIWHTTFGLDETNWSFPHSMFGLGPLHRLPRHHLLPRRARAARAGRARHAASHPAAYRLAKRAGVRLSDRRDRSRTLRRATRDEPLARGHPVHLPYPRARE